LEQEERLGQEAHISLRAAWAKSRCCWDYIVLRQEALGRERDFHSRSWAARTNGGWVVEWMSCLWVAALHCLGMSRCTESVWGWVSCLWVAVALRCLGTSRCTESVWERVSCLWVAVVLRCLGTSRCTGSSWD
jgi:hypothetical protein